ncbi:MAG: hypothetical protein KUL82_00130 [Bdellovibrio sp.]|nr:hypothetical protein [Bdellovibrio sp.]
MTVDMISLRNELKSKLLAYHSERGLSHLGSCLSSLDILTSLFWGPLKEEDHFILSKGHAASLLYLILNKKGLLSDQDLQESCRDGSLYGAHPPFQPPQKHPWWGFGSGSLGYGIGLGCGVALAKRMKNDLSHVYVLVSEGDLNEGSSWESLHFAAHHQLKNLTVLFDHNQVQALGNSSEIFPLHHLPTTLEHLGWDVHHQEGHDLTKIDFNTVSTEKPRFFIFSTQKNQGLENLFSPLEAHYKWPNKVGLP